ncbi:hypothetical protein ACUW97_000886 [Kocuria rhizophila]
MRLVRAGADPAITGEPFRKNRPVRASVEPDDSGP